MDASESNKQTSQLPTDPYQRTLFPLDIRDIYNNDQGSADLQIIATAMNNKDYAVKTINDGNGYVPVTELFCYEIARELSIATPNYALIKLKDGSIGFGSEWEGGALILKEKSKTLDILLGRIPIRGLTSFLSKVYALDLFINNIDRHFGNYIFRDSYGGAIALAYDFSRAWYAFEPKGYECLNANENTSISHKMILSSNNFDPSTAKSTLDEISRISEDTIKKIMSNIPDSWLPDDVRDEIFQWWSSADMQDRIIKLKGGIH